jgi:hypothetical protein
MTGAWLQLVGREAAKVASSAKGDGPSHRALPNRRDSGSTGSARWSSRIGSLAVGEPRDQATGGEQSVRVERTSRTVLLCLGVLMVSMSAGCGEPPALDTSLLTGEPCEPPCWQGLTPGQSTLQEVNEFMRTSGFVNPGSVHRSQLHRSGQWVGVSIWWRSTVGGGSRSNKFIVEGGVLDSVTIYPDYVLTLQRLIDRYGPPENYVAGLPISGPSTTRSPYSTPRTGSPRSSWCLTTTGCFNQRRGWRASGTSEQRQWSGS